MKRKKRKRNEEKTVNERYKRREKRKRGNDKK